MADATFIAVIPPLKAIDAGDGTYWLSITPITPPGGTDISFTKVLPALKAVDNGDGTYLVSMRRVT